MIQNEMRENKPAFTKKLLRSSYYVIFILISKMFYWRKKKSKKEDDGKWNIFTKRATAFPGVT